jgi:MFS transporter, ACDE family, multidrug resistance protein
MLIPVLPTIKGKLGISSLQVSLIIASYACVSIILIPIAGYLLAFGKKKIIMPSLIITGIGGLLSGLSCWLFEHSCLWILIGRVLQGIGAAGAAPIVLALVGDMFKNGKVVSVGLGIVETSNTLGKVLSPIFGATLARRWQKAHLKKRIPIGVKPKIEKMRWVDLKILRRISCCCIRNNH